MASAAASVGEDGLYIPIYQAITFMKDGLYIPLHPFASVQNPTFLNH
jgi:hypothetical protein